MAQGPGFLKRVYKIYDCCQLEDVNCSFARRTSCISPSKYMATCKSKLSHVRLEHSRLLPGQRPITLPKLKVMDSRGEFQQRYVYAVSLFTLCGATAHDHVPWRHLRPALLRRGPWAAPRLSRTSPAGSSRREPRRRSG